MPKNPNNSDVTPFDQPRPISPGTREYLENYLPDRDAAPFRLSDLTKQMGLTGPRIKASDLVGKPFVILAAKTFGSSFDPERHAYFCIIRDVETNQIMTTVLGGFAVTDILDAVCESDFRQPLLVTLTLHEGGRYGKYYTLE